MGSDTGQAGADVARSRLVAGQDARLGEPRGLHATAYICAPELARHVLAGGNGLKVSGAEDIWAVGVLVMYMMSGQLPFAAEDAAGAEKYKPIAALTLDDVKAAMKRCKVRPQGQLEAFLLSCLNLDPDERSTADRLLTGGWIGGNMATEVVRQTRGTLESVVQQQRTDSGKLDSLQESVEVVEDNS